MTVIGVALFGLASFALAGAAFALMWKNISDINKPIKLSLIHISEPTRPY